MKSELVVVCMFNMALGSSLVANADQTIVSIPVPSGSVSEDANGNADFSGESIQFLSKGSELARPYASG